MIVAFPDVDPTIYSLFSKRNSLKDEDESFDKPHLWYSTSEVIRALELFIEGGKELSSSNTYRWTVNHSFLPWEFLFFFSILCLNICIFITFRYDLIDLTRQALAKYANDLFLDVIEAYKSHDSYGVAHLSEKFLELVDDMDTLLASHEGFLLGPWLESSKQLAVDDEQEKQVS